jgi:DNA helicase-2/ATP-dependent DNA helicase PcrA
MEQQGMGVFDNLFEHGLNPEQKQVVVEQSGVLLVRAGAGSGKTRVITARMAYLISRCKVLPYTIVALTFTNKAAREMRERLHQYVGALDSVPYVGTFHSYCLKLLKTHSYFLPFPEFSILDAEDQEKIVRQLIIKYGLQKKVTARNVLAAISRIKNESLDNIAQEADPVIQELFVAYEKEKRIAQSFDFDDLLHEVLKLFRTNTAFKEKFQATIKHILVDEYQDTNKVQHELLLHMTKNSAGDCIADSLCVVGDEDQSIYSWRGATIANIVEFKKDFPQAKAVTIAQNYRSVQPILQVANKVIAHNSFRSPKNLYSTKNGTDRVRLLSVGSGYQEAEALALFLKTGQKSLPLKEFALLYRSHYQSRSFEEAFIRHAVPYKILGGIQFYDREEIKDLICYLRLVVNPFDRVALFRVINCPNRGLGDKFQEQFTELWNSHPALNFRQIAEMLLTNDSQTKSKQDSLQEFISFFQSVTSADLASSALEDFIKKTGYLQYLATAFDKEIATAKTENVTELLNSLYFSEKTQAKSMVDFLEDVALLREKATSEEDKEVECIRLMTLHSAKGLEFNTVILAGLEEGVLPSSHSRYSESAVEEERRLLYVGITRACERLLLMHARYRYTYGQMVDQVPSRFIQELDTSVVTEHDASQWNTHHFIAYFSDWLKQSNSLKELFHQVPVKKQEQAKKETVIQTGFKLYQLVQHESFGPGIIQKIEEKAPGNIYLTVRFAAALKKIEARYVRA